MRAKRPPRGPIRRLRGLSNLWQVEPRSPFSHRAGLAWEPSDMAEGGTGGTPSTQAVGAQYTPLAGSFPAALRQSALGFVGAFSKHPCVSFL